jgi:nucleoside-diphosphate-sugar epimerase
MRIAVIGGTGHIGSYLVPRLVTAGHDVISVSRGQRQPYRADPAWATVTQTVINRDDEEPRGAFGAMIAGLHPDAVIDLTCYTPASAEQLVNALRGRITHFLHCGTIWVHGHSVEVPTRETQPRRPLGEYGQRKAAIERYLLDEAHQHGFPATIFHPGHLVGSGWMPINPVGNFDPRVFADLAAGREVTLPNFGMETLHHVHADDVSQGFVRALEQPAASIGESFHVVSPAAMTLRGYAEQMAEWFGREPRLQFLPFDEWRQGVSEREATITRNHLMHSSNCSITKAQTRLGYTPRSSLEAVQEALRDSMLHVRLAPDYR